MMETRSLRTVALALAVVISQSGCSSERTGTPSAIEPTAAPATPLVSPIPTQEKNCRITKTTTELVGEMAEPRAGQTMTLLDDGRVLAVGGSGPGFVSLASAEIWDPRVNLWVATGSMAEPRMGHGAVDLGDGRVLVVGGWKRTHPGEPVEVLSTTEIYEPSTGRWSPGPSMNEARLGSDGVTLLSNGRVLVVGGAETSTSEVLDPQTLAWTYTGPMHAARSKSAVSLLDGRVLAIGGFQWSDSDSDGGPTSAEIYDPLSDTWTLTAPLPSRQGLGSGVLLTDGRVLSTGGFLNGRGNLPLTLIYNPSVDEWVRGVAVVANGHSSVVLDNGTVALIGVEVNSVRVPVYDPLLDSWDLSTRYDGKLGTGRERKEGGVPCG
ncbi:MAG: hypothetical protein HS107_04260 [Thermoflexaceae bacterium]|nr:hypothetical protein [Thermoflexaceae bacterium]